MRKVFVAVLLVFVLLVSGVAGTVAMAQGPTPTTPPAGKFAQLLWQALANKLGITVAALQQDFNAARQDAINEAVKQGLITQAQADNLESKLDQNQIDLTRPLFRPGLFGR